MMKSILIFFLSIIAISAEARMYQWVEPSVGTTQLSGKPPTWYRSDKKGPRVFVFENGRLIDDTAVKVSDDVRRRMRQEAFILVEKDRQKAQERIAKAEEKNKKLKSNKPEIETQEIEDPNEKESESALELLTDTFFQKDKKDKQEEDMSERDVDALKAIISDWEASQTESAKQALE